jgi:uncharacterized protein (DUF427 family)
MGISCGPNYTGLGKRVKGYFWSQPPDHAIIYGGRNEIMKENQAKLPGPDHPITIESNPARVVISVADRIIADTRKALTLQEAAYPAVQYIPRQDVDMSLLERTDHSTYCPYKGDCSYYSVPIGGDKSVNAAWSYEAPYAAVAEIKDHLAFYPNRVDEQR